jgi:recombinational DNA repair protein RecR
MNPSVQALEDQYFLLRGSLSTLSDQGATPEQLDQMRAQIVQSRTNYWTALNKIIHGDDPQVQQLVTQLNAEQETVKTTISQLGNVAKVIDAATKAVSIGSQVVAKAISL